MLGLGRAASRGLATFVALVVALVASLLIGGQLAGAEAAAATASRGVVAKTDKGKMTSKVFGTASDGSDVSGTFTPVKFVKRDGKLKAKGVLRGVVTHNNGTKERFTVIRTVKVKKINGQRLTGLTAVSPRAMADCDVLNLVLGPLHLDVLGLVVDLNRIVLNIVAVSGAGNLLGNLLCAVAGLLDGGLGGLLGQLTNLLNQILDALGLGG